MKPAKKQRRGRIYLTHTCRICGADFQAARANARYCSTRCRKQISRRLIAAGFTGQLKPLLPTLEKIEQGTWGR
jgi:hypothetical protein